jgi:hypothetical protein
MTRSGHPHKRDVLDSEVLRLTGLYQRSAVPLSHADGGFFRWTNLTVRPLSA